MSLNHMLWAFEQDLPALPKLVLLKLASRAKETDGTCYPSIDRTAKDCGMSRNSVKRAIKVLAKRKLIKVVAQFNNGEPTSNLYTLLGRATQSLGRATQAPQVGPDRATKHKALETNIEDKRREATKVAVKKKCEALKYMDSIIEQNKDLAPVASILDIAGLGRGNGH